MTLQNVNITQLSKGTGINYPTLHNLINREDLGTTQLITLNKVAVFLQVNIDDLYTLREV